MSRRDGGPAFPVSFGPDGTPGYADGMTLRDWFAGQAIAGILAGATRHDPNHRSAMDDRSNDGERRVKWAYRYADAMLEERER